VPPLRAHPEDLPALVRWRVLRVWKTNPKLDARFIRSVPRRRDEIAIEPEFLTALLRHDFKLNVRELDRLLEQSFIHSSGNTLEPPPELMPEIAPPATASTVRARAQAALDEHRDMNVAAAALGISRYALGRRIGRY
jgi:DNA-binding NtrC family response regulator